MKILLISSGFSGIYPYLEQSIEDAFKDHKHSVLKINPDYTKETKQKIERFDPDLVFTLVGFKMDPFLIQFLQKRNLILGIWLTEDPYYSDDTIHILKDYDYIFTVDLGAYSFYKKRFPEKNIYHLLLGTDPSLYFPSLTQSQPIFDLCLVGYPYPERAELVNHVMNTMKCSVLLVGPSWKKFLPHSKHVKNLTIINRWVEPPLVREVFNQSKIVLNPHRDYDFIKNKNELGIKSKSINNRTFDIAACDTFQLIPTKTDLSQHFDPTNEIVPYKDHNHCLELIDQFLKAEKERKRYRGNAYKRVMNYHTFSHRVQFILEKCK